MLYFSSSFDKSLTIVAGLQLIYTNFSGLNFNMLFIVVSSKPLLGGSTNTTFGVICFSCNKFSKTFSTSPQVNSIFSILFIFAFSFASSIACSTISIPYTLLQTLKHIFLLFLFHNIDQVKCHLLLSLLLQLLYCIKPLFAQGWFDKMTLVKF